MEQNSCLIQFKKLINSFNDLVDIDKNDLVKSTIIIIGTFDTLFILILIISFIPTLWWSVHLIGYSTGKEFGEFKINEFKTKGCFKHNDENINTCFKIIDEKGKTLHEGILIAINEKEIAMFEKEGLFVFFRKDNFILQRKTN